MHRPFNPISHWGSRPGEHLLEILQSATQVIGEDELFTGLIVLDSVFGLGKQLVLV